MELGNDCRHNIQDFWISSVWDVPVVVNKDSFQKRWNDVSVDRFMVVRFLDVCIHKLQYFFLYSPETSNFGCFGRIFSCEALACPPTQVVSESP